MRLESRISINPDYAQMVILDAGEEISSDFIAKLQRKLEDQYPYFSEYVDQREKKVGIYGKQYRKAFSLSCGIVLNQLIQTEAAIPLTDKYIDIYKRKTNSLFQGPFTLEDSQLVTQDNDIFSRRIAMFWQILESRYKPLIPIFTKQLESSENIKISYLGFFDGFMPFYRKSVDMCEKGETHFPGTEPKI